MLGLIHNALGTLWLSLHNLEDKRYSIGHKLMLASICYLFVSGTFVSEPWSLMISIYLILIDQVEYSVVNSLLGSITGLQ